jgi:heptosyltransferase-2
MKNILIVKTGAAGDVLRTTFILEDLSKKYKVYWLTDPLCVDLIDTSLVKIHTDVFSLKNIFFEKIYLLEEDIKLLLSIQNYLSYKYIVGCYVENNKVLYHAPDTEWLDMSLVSKFGIENANKFKLSNTKTFQELIAPIFDLQFIGQKYNKLKYNSKDAIVKGDIAIAKTAGNKWPNKNWAYYDELKIELEKLNYKVNYLPNRNSIKEHVADIAAHKLIICGDSLPMHIATALNIPSIALFTCTSHIEIFGYNLITKIVSPKLNQYYYQREFDNECVKSISINEILNKTKI